MTRTKPVFISSYDENMGGVDLIDLQPFLWQRGKNDEMVHQNVEESTDCHHSKLYDNMWCQSKMDNFIFRWIWYRLCLWTIAFKLKGNCRLSFHWQKCATTSWKTSPEQIPPQRKRPDQRRGVYCIICTTPTKCSYSW